MRHDYPCLKQGKNGVWYIHYDRLIRRSLKTCDKNMARQKFAMARKEYLARNLMLFKGRENVTLDGFSKEYLEGRETERTKGTVHIDKVALQHLIDFFGETALISSITGKRLKDFHRYLLNRAERSGESLAAKTEIDRKGRKKIKNCRKVTVNIYIRHLKAAFKQALSWNYIVANPYAEIDQFKEEEPANRFFSGEEVERILGLVSEKDSDFRDMILVYLYTSCRASEVCNMKREDIKHNPVVNRDYIEVRDVKNKKMKYIYVSKELKPVLKRIPVESGFLFTRWKKPQTVSKKFLRLLRKAGIEDAHLHHTRHTTLSWLAMMGVSKKAIQKMAGHTQGTTTDRYMHLSPDYEVDAVDKLDFSNATKVQQNKRVRVIKQNKSVG